MIPRYQNTQTMPGGMQPREKRTAPKISSRVNSLISACNKDDRFKLLEDKSVLPASLDNPIHPIFRWFDCDGPLKQTLQLASQFIAHDSLLVFFIPLLYGYELTIDDNNTSKTYLSDPLSNVTEAKKNEYINGVREALHCLSHSIEFEYMKPEKRVYARTVLGTAMPVHTSTCSSAFQKTFTAKIEIADKFEDFYYDPDGYAAASLCAQFRQDFLFATTLVHEIVHAVGVLRRGNLREPCIRADYPDTEWGYGWEHFMFGNIMNPQDRSMGGTHLLMRKVWTDQTSTDRAGGKEYSDVPMSYIAQWFQQKTWDIVAEEGPLAIPPPITHFKIQSSNKFGAWVVSSDCTAVKPDLIALREKWDHHALQFGVNNFRIGGSKPSEKILWQLQTFKQLQTSSVSAPVRTQRIQQCRSCDQNLPSTSLGTYSSTLGKLYVPPEKELLSVSRTSSPTGSSNVRKRRAESQDDSERASKVMKR